MPEEPVPPARRFAFDPLAFLRGKAGVPAPLTDNPAEPVMPPAPAPQMPAPPVFVAPPLPAPGNLPGEGEIDNAAERETRERVAAWSPIQTAPGYRGEAENVRRLLAVYTAPNVEMETMQICIPSYRYGSPTFEDMKAQAREAMIELALPRPLSHVELERHTYYRGESQVALFTNADRTNSFLFVSQPLPMIYQWQGGPNPALNTPIAELAPEQVANIVVDLPEAFTREMPVRMPRQQFDYRDADFDDDIDDVEAANREAFQGADGLSFTQVARARAEAWLPAVLSPGYASEARRVQFRGIMEQFAPVPLESIQMIAAGVNGPTATRLVLADIEQHCIEVNLPPHLAGIPLQGGEPNITMFADFEKDLTLLHSSSGGSVIYKWTGGPAVGLSAAYEEARSRFDARAAALAAHEGEVAAGMAHEAEAEAQVDRAETEIDPIPAAPPAPPAPPAPAPETNGDMDGPGV